MDIERITDAELEVLKVLWNRGILTAREICNQVSLTNKWSDKTIRTLLSRLCDKEIVEAEKSSKEYQYKALVSKEEYQSFTKKTVVNKLFGGSVKSMLLNFMDTSELTQSDVDELKEFLDTYGK